MLQKLHSRVLTVLVSALLVGMFIVPSAAAGYPDALQKGSITVNIDVTGTVTCYQIAQYDDITRKYVTTLLFADSGFDPEHLGADDAVELWDYIQALERSAPLGQTKTIVSSSVKFTDLSLGIYLMVHVGPSGAPAALPFFVTVPMQEEDSYVYDITADSKVKIVTPTPAPPKPTPAPVSPVPSDPVPTEPLPTEPEPSPPEPTMPVPSDPEPWEPDSDIPNWDDSPLDEPSPEPSVPIPTLPGSTQVSSGDQLPNTGQLNWPIPVLVVLGLILFGFGWYLHQSRRGK